MKDVFNKEIQDGDWIGYAVRSCNSGQLRICKVLEAHDDDVKVLGCEMDYWGNFHKSARPGTIDKQENMVKLDSVSDEVKDLFK